MTAEHSSPCTVIAEPIIPGGFGRRIQKEDFPAASGQVFYNSSRRCSMTSGAKEIVGV